jgi:hypothetical protein
MSVACNYSDSGCSTFTLPAKYNKGASGDGKVDMNWDAIGASAETLGAIAVIATLVYLTVQLRQNTRAIEHSTHRGVLDDAHQWMYKMIENPEIAELYLSGMRGDELSSRDRIRFSLLLNTLFVHWNHALVAGAFEVVNNSQIKGVLSYPGGAAYWRRTVAKQSISLSPEFIELANSLLEELERESAEEVATA